MSEPKPVYVAEDESLSIDSLEHLSRVALEACPKDPQGHAQQQMRAALQQLSYAADYLRFIKVEILREHVARNTHPADVSYDSCPRCGYGDGWRKKDDVCPKCGGVKVLMHKKGCFHGDESGLETEAEANKLRQQ